MVQNKPVDVPLLNVVVPTEDVVAKARLSGNLIGSVLTQWTIPDFDTERDIDALLGLEAGHQTADGLILTERRCLPAAETPG